MKDNVFETPIEDMSAETLRHLAETVEKYREDPAWVFFKSVIERDLMAAALSLCNPKQVHQDIINFQRGAMYASNQLMSLPDRILMQLHNALLLKESDPAKAGKE